MIKNNIKKKRILLFFFWAFIAIIYIIISKYGFSIPCIFHSLTNFYCPGCGMTRCILSILEGDFYQAFRYNQLGFILLPLFISYLVYKISIWLTGRNDKIMNKIPVWFIYSLIVITILFGILRNIEIFSYLKPTIIS